MVLFLWAKRLGNRIAIETKCGSQMKFSLVNQFICAKCTCEDLHNHFYVQVDFLRHFSFSFSSERKSFVETKTQFKDSYCFIRPFYRSIAIYVCKIRNCFCTAHPRTHAQTHTHAHTSHFRLLFYLF